jgi:hypothetical protein
MFTPLAVLRTSIHSAQCTMHNYLRMHNNIALLAPSHQLIKQELSEIVNTKIKD